MSVSSTRAVVIQAPAKLNLGLEVLGRRSDGYHDLATIFITVSPHDELTLTTSERLRLQCDDAEIRSEDNLAFRALQELQRHTTGQPGAQAYLRKAIPASAGLGGASSDAAATLVAARELWRLKTSDEELAVLAGRLGSDVPFFLRGGCAIGYGRGEIIEPLPLPTDVQFVVVVPTLAIPRKTATLYAALQQTDLSDGSRISAQAARLRAHLGLDPTLLGNAFTRPLYERVPALSRLPDMMRKAGATSVAVSGAGPAHYAATCDPERADLVATRLKGTLGTGMRIFVVAPIPERSSS